MKCIIFYLKKLKSLLILKFIKINYVKILKTMLPFIPHFASECLSEISINPILDNNWPNVDQSRLKSKSN